MTPWSKKFIRKLISGPGIPFKSAKLARITVDDLDRGLLRRDKDLLAILVKQCSSSRSLHEGKRVHSHIVEAGLGGDIFLANHLVRMYGNCRCVEEARRVFDGIQAKNVVSWNVIIASYSQNGYLQQARNMFEQLPAANRNVISWNIIVAAYAQNGYLAEARRLFEEMPRRDVISWNSIIAAYARRELGSEAMLLFRRMDVQPDKVTYTSCIDACTSVFDLHQGIKLHEAVTRRGWQCHVVVATALVNLYGKCGRAEEARRAFECVAEPDLALQTSMLRAYGENGQLPRAQRLFDSMTRRDSVAWTSMIAACASNGQLSEAKRLFDRMQDRSPASWNAMIAAYSQNGEFLRALELFRLMDLEGVEICSITFISVLDACACLTDLQRGRMVHSLLLESRLPPYVVAGTAVVNMYGKCGNLAEARRIFDGLTHRNLATWNALLTCYAQKGYGDRVLELYCLLNLEGEFPDNITFIVVLSTCSHAGNLQAGWEHFTSISADFGTVPSEDQYICMVDVLGRAGKLDEAEELIENMPFEPSIVAWTAILGGCEVHGDVKRGKQISKKIFSMEDLGIGPYLLLANLYAAAGCDEELAELKEIMRKRGIKPR